jgi:hypothetical protein
LNARFGISADALNCRAAIWPLELIALDRRFERRVEEIVFEPQRAVFEAPRRRAHLAIILKEEAFGVGSVLHNLEAEWHFCVVGDDDRVPQSGNARRRRHGRAGTPGRNGDKH